MQPSDTAYPRFKSRLTQSELERFYTLTDGEQAYCNSFTRSNTTRLGFALLLKTYQRLGYFVTSEQVPNAIAEQVASSMGESYDRENLRQYGVRQRFLHFWATSNNFCPTSNVQKIERYFGTKHYANIKSDIGGFIAILCTNKLVYEINIPNL